MSEKKEEVRPQEEQKPVKQEIRTADKVEDGAERCGCGDGFGGDPLEDSYGSSCDTCDPRDHDPCFSGCNFDPDCLNVDRSGMEINFKCNPKVSFLTWNIYQGFDVAPLFAAPPEQIPEVVTQVFRQFLATNFPVRAKAIAKAIASEKPDLIGLQEAVRVELIIPTFGTVTYDFIDILLEALEERCLKYKVAARNNNAKGILPDSNGNFVQFLERDAILIRKNHKLDVLRSQ